MNKTEQANMEIYEDRYNTWSLIEEFNQLYSTQAETVIRSLNDYDALLENRSLRKIFITIQRACHALDMYELGCIAAMFSGRLDESRKRKLLDFSTNHLVLIYRERRSHLLLDSLILRMFSSFSKKLSPAGKFSSNFLSYFSFDAGFLDNLCVQEFILFLEGHYNEKIVSEFDERIASSESFISAQAKVANEDVQIQLLQGFYQYLHQSIEINSTLANVESKLFRSAIWYAYAYISHDHSSKLEHLYQEFFEAVERSGEMSADLREMILLGHSVKRFRKIVTRLLSSENFDHAIRQSIRERTEETDWPVIDSALEDDGSEGEDYLLAGSPAFRFSSIELQRSLFVRLNRVASRYHAKGDYEYALFIYLRSSSVAQRIFGSKSLPKALILNSLGMMYRRLDNKHKALDAFDGALDILRKKFGPDRPIMAPFLLNKALVYIQSSDFGDALTINRKVVDLLKEASDTMIYANALNNLGIALFYLDRSDEAVAVLKEAISIAEQNSKTDKVKLAEWLNNLAMMQRSRGEEEHAEGIHARVRSLYQEIVERDLGKDNKSGLHDESRTLLTKYNEAELVSTEMQFPPPQASGRFDEAELLAQAG